MKYLALIFLTLSIAGAGASWYQTKRLDDCQDEKARLEALAAPDKFAAEQLKRDFASAAKVAPAESAEELNAFLEARYPW